LHSLTRKVTVPPAPDAESFAWVVVFSPRRIGCPHRSHIIGFPP